MVEYIFEDFNDRLSDIEKRVIVYCLETAVEACHRLLPIAYGICCFIEARKGENSKKLPVEGLAGDKRITIILDTRYPVYRFPEQHHLIASTFSHEWYHVAQDDLGRGYGRTIAHAIASEGRALAFELQIVNRVPFIAKAVSRKRLVVIQEDVKEKLNSRSHQLHADLFVGGKGTTYPRWFGYSLAYAVVSDWLKCTGVTASEAINVSANKIIAPWRDGRRPIKRHLPTVESIL